MEKVFRTHDGCIFPKEADARRHEASIAVSMLVRNCCSGPDDDGLYDEGTVTEFLIEHLPEITEVVQVYRAASDNLDPVKVQAFVAAYVYRNLDDIEGQTAADYKQFVSDTFYRVWTHLLGSGVTDSTYTNFESELCLKAWKEFRE